MHTQGIDKDESVFFPVVLKPQSIGHTTHDAPSPAFSPLPPFSDTSDVQQLQECKPVDPPAEFVDEPATPQPKQIRPLPKWVVCYVVHFASPPGKFDPVRAKALGVKPGPAYGQLQRGINVELPDGRVVRPEDVLSERQPGPVFAVIDCPSLEYLEALVGSDDIHQLLHADGRTPQAIIHQTPADVFELPQYQSWMKAVAPNAVHIALAPEYMHSKPVFISAATQQVPFVT